MKATFMHRLIIALAVILIPTLANATWIFKNGRFIEVEEIATLSPEEHYSMAVDAWNHQDWEEAAREFRIVITNFPKFSQVAEANFFAAASHFFLGELDMANDELTEYLRLSCSPEYLEEAMDYKFSIAEQFRCGAKRRCFGSQRFPKWVSGYETAICIYDEIVSTLPCHDMAAQALFSKGSLLCELNDFPCSIEAYQTLIRRFPLHELAPESYMAILQVYLVQATCEFQNPDLLALGEIVLKRFKEDFPNEARVCQAEADLLELKEIYAFGLYDTGQFYERICQPQASALYYSSAIRQFPDTIIAENARQRLCCLMNCHPCLDIPEGTFDVEENVDETL